MPSRSRMCTRTTSDRRGRRWAPARRPCGRRRRVDTARGELTPPEAISIVPGAQRPTLTGCLARPLRIDHFPQAHLRASRRRWGHQGARTRQTCDRKCGETHFSGGAFMQKRFVGLVASTMIVFAACGGAATPTPSGSAPAASPPAASGSEVAPSGSGPAAGAPDLFGTKYKDKRVPGTTGGQIVYADWQEATEFNYYYQGQVTEANLSSATQAGLDTVTDDFKYAPDLATEIPTLDNGGVKVPGDSGDAMTVTWKLRSGLKWSDGQPLTCDDFKFTQDWIMDKDNTGLYAGTTGYEDVKTFDCTDPQTMVL